MYRVFLVPTGELSPKELWLDAHAVNEPYGGEFWDFVDREDHLIRRIAKRSVRGFVVTADRRKPRPLEDDLYPDALRPESRAGHPASRPT